MIHRTLSGTIQGVTVYTVEVETNCSDKEVEMGGPVFHVIGLPDAAIRESKERIRSAIWASGLQTPRGNVMVNLAPAAMRKAGALYDLPIALCLIAFKGGLPAQALSDTMVVGELGLNGEVRGIVGALPLAMHAKELGLKRMIVPAENAREAAAVEGLAVYGVGTLAEAVRLCCHPDQFQPVLVNVRRLFEEAQRSGLDFVDVKGQESAKRALVIAAAGNHNLLMVGSPGVGKSLIANRIPGILPPLALKEAMEVTRLYSIAGLLPKDGGLIVERPFRAPHHTVSDAGLLGGGKGIPHPGEITLAHRGVLFLDELPEFRRNVLEALRQPLENGEVTVARASGAFVFPCRFMLVAAMNPCPCGYYGSPGKHCRCSSIQVQSYRSRISGPLLDRIDLHVEVPPLPKDTLTAKRSGPSSAQLREQILAARAIQLRRFQGTGIWSNADIAGTALDRFCTLTDSARKFLDLALNAKHLSARSYDRILRVARTCADLNGHEQITDAEISEACQYRVLDQELQSQGDPWG
jgi:magnesium chelatase family protein